MRNQVNLKKSLESLKRHLLRQIEVIDKTINDINKMKPDNICPSCLSGDVRRMVGKELFCRSCGYDSRSSQNR